MGGGEVSAVLLPLVATLLLAGLGIALVAKVAHSAMRRLGLDVVSVLTWLGLADEPVSEFTVRRRQQEPGRAASAASRY